MEPLKGFTGLLYFALIPSLLITLKIVIKKIFKSKIIDKLSIDKPIYNFFYYIKNFFYDFYLLITIYVANIFFMFTKNKIINYEIIKIYLQTKILRRLLVSKFGNVKNGDLVVITNNNSFSFTHDFLPDGYVIPSIYEYYNNCFKIYKYQPDYESQTAEEYIEELSNKF